MEGGCPGKAVRSLKQGKACSDLYISKFTLVLLENQVEVAMQVRDGSSSCGDGRNKSRFERYIGSSICRIWSSGWIVGPFINVVELGRGHDLSGGWEAQALLFLELAVGPPSRKKRQAAEAHWKGQRCCF